MQSIINNKIKLKLLAGFGTAILLIILVQIYSGTNIRQMIKNQESKARIAATVGTVKDLKSEVLSFESKMRGFVLTGNERFLAGNEKAQLSSLAKIKALLGNSDSLEDRRLLTALDSLVSEKVNFNRSILIAYNHDNNTKAIEIINTGKGKTLMDQIIRACDKIIVYQQLQSTFLDETTRYNSVIALNADLISGIIIILAIIISLLILFKDINDRIKLEKTLIEEKLKTEKLMIVKEQFMMNMSHELRTPLNAIIGFSNLAEETKLNNEQHEYIDAISDAGQQLLSIVDDILDFSKMENGLVLNEESSFSVKKLLSEIKNEFESRAAKKNILIEIKPDPQLPALLKGDGNRLKQVLSKLTDNAVKFSDQGNITISCVVLADKEQRQQLRFSVRDTGIGIKSDKLESIFELFSQGDNASTRNYGGIGLGLTMSKRIIESMNGVLKVTSNPGTGSDFSFELTFLHYEGTAEEATSGTSNQKRVLVLEENVLNKKFIELALTSYGMKADFAENIGHFLLLMANKEYDAAIADLHTAGSANFNEIKMLLNRIKPKTRLIAMLSGLSREEKEKYSSLGITQYLNRPFKADALYETINRAVA